MSGRSQERLVSRNCENCGVVLSSLSTVAGEERPFRELWFRVPATSGRMSTGRPTSYRREYCRQAHDHCLGATNEQLSEFFDVAPRTIDNWLVRFPEFADAVQRGRNWG